MYRPLPQLCKPEAKRKQEAKGKQDAKREQGVKREQEAEEQAKRPSGLIQRRFIGTLAEGAQVGTLRGYCRLVPECRDAT
jgi:hypothetical protein